MAADTPTVDDDKVQEFVGKVLTDTGGLTTTVLAAVGDRFGLFKDLHAGGPADSRELASRCGIEERYAREWLAAMAAAGYLAYEPSDGRYRLPAEHAPALVDEPAPTFFGGIHQELFGLLQRLDRLVVAFERGGGVAQEDFPPDVYVGMDRFTAMWHEHMLLQQWIPAVPDVTRLLEAGADVADVGCGQGRAIVKLAQAFPASRYVGYDNFGPNVERARANADAAGVGDRVRFEQLDVVEGLPALFDVVTTWDVVHDAVDPVGLLGSIRRALRPGGVYLCLDINCSDRQEDNVGPLATLLYGFSVLYCMTTSLAHGGAGLGTLGLPETKLRELCTQAGFATVTKVPLDNPFNNFYDIRP